MHKLTMVACTISLVLNTSALAADFTEECNADSDAFSVRPDVHMN